MAYAFQAGDEFRVNTVTAERQGDPAIAALGNGNFVVTWTDYNSAWDSNVKAQIFGAAGNKIGSEFLVNSAQADQQAGASATGLGDGRFVITWQDNSTGLANIKAQVFDASGAKSGGEIVVNTQMAGSQWDADVTALSDGGFIVSWDDFSGTGGDSSVRGIKAQLFDASGAKSGSEFLINTQTANSQENSEITGLSGGGFVVTWTDFSGTLGDAAVSGIKAQVFDATGAKVGTEMLVNSQVAGGQTASVVAGLTTGGFVVAWADNNAEAGSPGGIKAQRFDASGSPVGSEILVNAVAGSGRSTPAITALDDGGFAISWNDANSVSNDGDLTGVKIQLFDASGAKDGNEFVVNATTAGQQVNPDLTRLAGGGFAVTWYDGTFVLGSPNIQDIYARIFSPVSAGPSAGNDALPGTAGNDSIDGLAGNDTLTGLAGDDSLYGSEGQDSLLGGAGQDLLSGGEGNDVLSDNAINPNETMGGNDTLIGGAGSDVLHGAGGNDLLWGDGAVDSEDETSPDTISGGFGNDTLHAGNGADSLSGGDGEDLIWAAGGNDTVNGDIGSDTIYGGDGDDFLHGGADVDIIRGGAGNDTIHGGFWSDQLYGGTGNNVFVGGETINDSGFDDVIYSEEAYKVSVDLVHGRATHYDRATGAVLSGDTMSGIEGIFGTAGDDTVQGDNKDNRVVSLGGNDLVLGGYGLDTLVGGEGNDTLHGGDDQDTLMGEGGNDTLSGGAHSDSLNGGNGDDTLNGGARWDTLEGGHGNDWLDGGEGNDRMWGGTGNDLYIVDHEGDRVFENANEGLDVVRSSISYTLTDHVERLYLTGTAIAGYGNALDNDMHGHAGYNALSGGGGNDTLFGWGGDDNLNGDAGHDSLLGGEGRDVLTGADGSDVLDGGNGDDTLAGGERWDTLSGGDGNDFLTGGEGNDVMFGGAGNDIYYVDHVGDRVFEGFGEGADLVWSWISHALSANVEDLYLTGEGDISGTGNGLSNHIEGTSGANALSGGLGNDSLWGWDGNDTLSGGNDHDILSGGEGADSLTGGHGNDVLGGGAGADDFVFSGVAVNGHDHVVDFVSGLDRLVFTGADYGFAGGHVLTASQFTTGSAAVGSAAQFVWDAVAGKLWWDADGAGTGAAFELALISNGATVTADDLVFT